MVASLYTYIHMHLQTTGFDGVPFSEDVINLQFLPRPYQDLIQKFINKDKVKSNSLLIQQTTVIFAETSNSGCV